MILAATAVCTDVQLLNILSIVKGLITLVTILVPVILILFVIVDIIKTTASADVDTKKLFKSVSKRVMAAFLIFLIPSLLNLVLNIVPSGNLYYLNCYQNASRSEALSIALSNVDTEMTKLEALISTANDKDEYNEAQAQYEITRQQVKLIPDKDVREEYEETLEKHRVTLNNIRASLSSNTNINTNPTTNTPSETNVAGGNIFIGDSRTVGMCKAVNICTSSTEGGSETCYNDQCIAKTGAGYSWYSNTAISKVNDILNKDTSKKYNIIINMGVNDVGSTGAYASNYTQSINNLATGNWKNHNIIFVSVNPVTDGKSNAYTSGVLAFNQSVKNNISSSVKYCDTYNNLSITPSSDGLHYSSDTSKSIYNYIINSCI